ncbi:MAG: phosphatase PAP2 family protein [Dermatophilaceae bacterium]|nr:phosphatase PAP2 family protein [Dermatophilaceae bacterium]
MSTTSTGLPLLQESWFRHINDFARNTTWLHSPMRLYAKDGVILFAFLLLVGWWLARRGGDLPRVARSLWAPLGVLLALAVNQPIANAVAEPRPYAALPHVLVLVSRSTDYSFPSDHAVMAGAVAFGTVLTIRSLGWIAIVMAVVMGFARVYVGAHFPLDVVAGIAVGAAVSAAGYLVVQRPLLALTSAVARTPFRPLVEAHR